ncbi:alpha/beta fold hydrolase [Marinivivus vitaminiproducens]|uniref:alpha/beta fold hydrolase n=1 Tax=Marinivivus vitaminiproducens TaxID=3035935 RepID=UPI0027A84F67|nr:alpha/beta hydrolase [Geminicoccaceae bacterium SCSIO 64248]
MRIRPAVLAACALCLAAHTAKAQDIDLQERFDPLGPDVRTAELAGGKTVGYIDVGPKDGPAVLFIGGAGTSVYIFAVTEFMRSLREQLGLRFVSVERDGFGLTDVTPDWTYDDYAGEVREVLATLGVERFSIAAISGGGPYAAAVASAMPDRVRSIHLMAALSEFDPERPDTMTRCTKPVEERTQALAAYAARPDAWWDLGPNAPTDHIPGWHTQAANDGARTFSMNGVGGDTRGLIAEYERFCRLKVADLSEVEAPVFIYQGSDDTAVRPVHADFWQAHFPNVAKRRDYPGEGHTVQYRHWDQVLIDMAGMDDRIVACEGGRSVLVPEAEIEARTADGASLGICAWQEVDAAIGK